MDKSVKSQIGFEAKIRTATDRTSLTRLTKFSDVAYLKSALIRIYFVFDIPVEKKSYFWKSHPCSLEFAR